MNGIQSQTNEPPTAAYSSQVDLNSGGSIQPGSPSWEAMDVQAKRAASQIAMAEAQRLPTPVLVEACLGYPFLGFYKLSDEPDSALITTIQEFNGFSVLLKRPDAGVALLEYYRRCVKDVREGRTPDLSALDFLHRFFRLPMGSSTLTPENKGALALDVLEFARA
ncbi:MAG: hypothetical protein NTY38_28160, partial [Acidobacteria bacterium]|nr:hypothetical protein [Acidobacteriota bacterium]